MSEKEIENERKELLQQIRDHIEKKGITHEELAERTGFIRSNVTRMLAGKFPPTLDNFLILCHAAGCKITIKKSNQ